MIFLDERRNEGNFKDQVVAAAVVVVDRLGL
jgi:hypothetical protein